MRSPQRVARNRVRLRSARVKSLMALRLVRKRRVKTAMGSDRNAQVVGEGRGLVLDAVVLGVATGRGKEFEAEPGGTVGGVNEGLGRVGSAVAARKMGLDMLP